MKGEARQRRPAGENGDAHPLFSLRRGDYGAVSSHPGASGAVPLLLPEEFGSAAAPTEREFRFLCGARLGAVCAHQFRRASREGVTDKQISRERWRETCRAGQRGKLRPMADGVEQRVG